MGFLWLLMPFAAAPSRADVSPREHLSLDANWKFHLGDNWPNALRLDKAGASGGPASEKFLDVGWRSVDLPHDWVVELPFDKNADTGHGSKPVGPRYPENSIGWYRRSFTLAPEDSGKRIWLTFDGVFRDATVWVNGWLVKHHEGGYYPFREDITDVVRFGAANTIAVRVDANKFEGWFYEGAGIYRHVWLDKTAPLAIAPEGIFVRGEFKNNVPADIAPIKVDVSLLNSSSDSTPAKVQCEIISPQGNSIAMFDAPASVDGDSSQTVQLSSQVSSPVLWTLDAPALYKLITSVTEGDKLVDRQETSFGIRTVGFDPNKGFLLNGQPCELYGTCNHQDMAGVGVAAPDALQDFRVLKLKEFGCNAIRTSHNPPNVELLDACDRLGMLVMDESRLIGSDSENMQKWDDQLRRDRNHACIAMWSVGNEEFGTEDTPQGANAAKAMQNLCHRLDPTRPVTYAAPEGDVFQGINSVIEVRGWNYHFGPDMEKYHAEHPNQSEVGTEQSSALGDRSVYEDDKSAGYVSPMAKKPNGQSLRTAQWWSYFATRPWLSGGFVWTGFDYRGEPTPYGWPCISSHFGILDTCGFPKDFFYDYYKAWWGKGITLALAPHWNWHGMEGQPIHVEAFSNCKAVELFLNGKSLGRQSMDPSSFLNWQVPYSPGVLSAQGFDDAGKVVAETKVETTDDAAAVALSADRPAIKADGADVSVVTVAINDANGRNVPTASNKLSFAIDGPGKIIGVGNGDPSCHEPDICLPPRSEKTVGLNQWKWRRVHLPQALRNANVAEAAADFDDSKWATTTTDGNQDQFQQDESAVFRAHLQLSADDLNCESIVIQFGRIDRTASIWINGQKGAFVANGFDSPAFEIKGNLHAGDNGSANISVAMVK